MSGLFEVVIPILTIGFYNTFLYYATTHKPVVIPILTIGFYNFNPI